MGWENFFQSIFRISIWSLAKGVVIFALFVYLAFALVVVRQVGMMTKVVSGVLNFPIKVFAWLHLLLAILVVIFAFIIL